MTLTKNPGQIDLINWIVGYSALVTFVEHSARYETLRQDGIPKGQHNKTVRP